MAKLKRASKQKNKPKQALLGCNAETDEANSCGHDFSMDATASSGEKDEPEALDEQPQSSEEYIGHNESLVASRKGKLRKKKKRKPAAQHSAAESPETCEAGIESDKNDSDKLEPQPGSSRIATEECSEHNELDKEMQEMPLGEVLALKQEIGLKRYNAAIMGGKDITVDQIRQSFKRDKKKRPREMSSKLPVSVFREIFPTGKRRKNVRDPRFDEKSGEFRSDFYHQNYTFLEEIKKAELQEIKARLKTETDSERKRDVKFLLQRKKNQEVSEQDISRRKQLLAKLKRDNVERLKQGKKPIYLKRSELKRKLDEEKYEALKKTGRLDKYLERKRRKKSKAKPFLEAE